MIFTSFISLLHPFQYFNHFTPLHLFSFISSILFTSFITFIYFTSFPHSVSFILLLSFISLISFLQSFHFTPSLNFDHQYHSLHSLPSLISLPSKVKYSLSGKVSQTNMWSRPLTQEEILSLAKCEVNLEGDLLTWSKDWQLYDIEEEVRFDTILCIRNDVNFSF